MASRVRQWVGLEGVFPVVGVGHENNDGPALYSIDTPSLSLFIKSNTLFVIATGGPTHVYTTHETRPRGQWLDKNTVAPVLSPLWLIKSQSSTRIHHQVNL